MWSVATTRDSLGWTAEFRIPLSQLRYSPAAGDQAWGVEFGREIQRTGESVFWAPLLPSDDGLVSRFGTLAGLRDLRAPRRFEVVPYVSAQAIRAPDTRAPGGPADPFYSSTEAEPRAGLDVKYGLSSNLTLTATVNPDFGQVESDPAQVNLGGFELFLQERRPFFVEGVDVFSFGRTRAFLSSNRPQLLYTRRIGRSPQRRMVGHWSASRTVTCQMVTTALVSPGHDLVSMASSPLTWAPGQSSLILMSRCGMKGTHHEALAKPSDEFAPTANSPGSVSPDQ